MKLRCDRKDESVWRVHLDAGDSGDVVFDGPGLAEFAALLDEVEGTPRCRVLVIESTAGVFCRGMDLRFLLAHAGEDHSGPISLYANCMGRLRLLDRPVVVLVDGEAMGGGVGLAAAGDVTIATSRSSFMLPEVVLGLIPAMVLPLLRERMPMQKARWLAISGTRIKAAEAASIGLVDRVVDEPIELETSLRTICKQLLRSNPRALAKLKAFGRDIDGQGCVSALEAGAVQTSKDLLELDTIAAIRGFLAGESPAWFERYRPGNR